MKNALEIIQFISYSTNAEVNKTSSWGNVKKEALNGLNRAVRLLWNSKTWNFRREIKKTSITVGKNSIPISGVLAQNGVRLEGKPLVYDEAIPFYEAESGKPTSYYITNKSKLVVYPTANARYNVTLDIFEQCPIVAADGTLKTEITEETDTLNLTEALEPLFIDCLSYLCNEVLNGDPTDEDYKDSNIRYTEMYRLLEEADTTKDYDENKGFKMPWQM